MLRYEGFTRLGGEGVRKSTVSQENNSCMLQQGLCNGRRPSKGAGTKAGEVDTS